MGSRPGSNRTSHCSPQPDCHPDHLGDARTTRPPLPTTKASTRSFKVRYERELFFGGQITPGATIDASHVFGQFFPYTVQDPYGDTVIPEDLGNYEPTEENNNPPKPPSYIIANAQAELAVRQGVASFFFHPYYDLTYLEQIVQGIQALGYTFVSAPSTETPTVATTSLASGAVGQAYSQNVIATTGVGAEKWSLASGSLPAGLTLATGTGAITGTPTSQGTATFTLRVTDSNSPAGSGTRALTITIGPPPPPPLQVTSTSLATGTVGQPYTATLAATGGTGAYTWSVTSEGLPPGLTLNASTGAITGTPTAQFSSPVGFTVTDSAVPTPVMASTTVVLTVGPATAGPSPTLGVYLDSTGYRGPGVAIFGVTVACSAPVAGTLTVSMTLSGVSGSVTVMASCPASGLAYIPVQVPGGWSAGTAAVNAVYQAAGATATAAGNVIIS